MKAKVTGKSAWQGTPASGTLDIEITGRYVDSSGNATVSHYTGVLNAAKTGWASARIPAEDLYVIVQGPDDPAGPRATFREVLLYADGKEVRTTFTRKLISTDLAGLIFDYAAPDPGTPAGFGDAPLSMQAAAAVIAQSAQVTQNLADIAQTTAGLQAAAAGAVPYAALAAFPSANLYSGKSAWATDTGFVYKSDGATWVKTGEVATPATIAKAAPLNTPITRQFFGMHVNTTTAPATAANPELGYGTVRLWDTLTSWRHLETAKGVWDTARLDALVDTYFAQGLDIILTLGQAPNWATGGVSASNAGTNYNTLPPTNPQDFADMVTYLANRYNGKIKYWEIWNEPNLNSTFYSGTVAQLVTLHQVAYTALKARNAANVVLAASPTGDQGGNGPAYMASMLAAGVGPYVDVFTAHLYGEAEPEARIEAAQRYRALMAQYGYSARELWDTESGFHDYRDWLTANAGSTAMSDAQGVAYILRYFLTALAGGVNRAVWYGLGYSFPNLTLANAGVLTQAGVAYQQLAADLIGARVVEYARLPGGGHALTFTRDGVDWAYAWTGDRREINLPISGTLDLLTVKRGTAASTGPEGDAVALLPTPARLGRSGRSLSRLSAGLMSGAVSTAEPASLNPLMLPVNTNANALPAGWSVSATLTDYAGGLDKGEGRPIVLQPTGQYQGMTQLVAEWLRPGDRYRVTLTYSLAASLEDEWLVWVTKGPFGELQLPSIKVVATGAGNKQTVSVEGVIPAGVNVPVDSRLRITTRATANWNSLTVFEFRMDRLSSGRPKALPPQIYDRTTAVFPATGSWRLGERARILDITDATTYGEFLTCITEGTFGSVGVGATVSATLNSPYVTASVPLRVGDVFILPGSAKRLTVVSKQADGSYQCNSTSDVTVAGGALAYAAPVFKALNQPTGTPPALLTVQQASTTQYAQADFRWINTAGKAAQQRMVSRLETITAGGNSDTSFYFEHQDSAGTTQRRWLSYNMANGQLVLSAASYSFGSGSATFNNGTINMTAAAGVERNVYFMSNFAYRWSIRITGGVEGGSNTGSDWQLLRISDASAFNTVLHAKRDTGFLGVGKNNPTEQLDVGGNVKITGLLKIPPVAKATLVAPATAGAGSIATINDGTAGKCPIVYCTGAAWVYMDGTAV